MDMMGSSGGNETGVNCSEREGEREGSWDRGSRKSGSNAQCRGLTRQRSREQKWDFGVIGNM